MYRYKDLHFRFSADTCTSTFVTANIFPWYLLIRENFANEAVPLLPPSAAGVLSEQPMVKKSVGKMGPGFWGSDWGLRCVRAN